jgi:hypothetical protein
MTEGLHVHRTLPGLALQTIVPRSSTRRRPAITFWRRSVTPVQQGGSTEHLKPNLRGMGVGLSTAITEGQSRQ